MSNRNNKSKPSNGSEAPGTGPATKADDTNPMSALAELKKDLSESSPKVDLSDLKETLANEKPADVKKEAPVETVVKKPAVTVKQPDPMTIKSKTTLPEINPVAKPEGTASANEIHVTTKQWMSAFDNRIVYMNQAMPLGKTVPFKVMAAQQLELMRITVSLITEIPQKDVRVAIAHILDAYNTEPALSSRGLMRGINDGSTGRNSVPPWYVKLMTLFSFTADPKVRFKIAGNRFDFSKFPKQIPAEVLARISFFYQV